MFTLYIQEPYYRIGIYRIEHFETEVQMMKRRGELRVYENTKTWTLEERLKDEANKSKEI